uniref:FNIP_M domain-containing protein n=1 Tax=Macrostomum lignano TaxID=282301 RepID=A0A1I8IQM5_9PLAT
METHGAAKWMIGGGGTAAATGTSSSSAASTPAPCRGDKIGICLIINSLGRPSSDERFYKFFFTHNAFFDALIVGLCDDVVQTLSMDPQVTRIDPLETVLKALRSVQQKISQLFHCPLLHNPAWLSVRRQPSLNRIFASSCLRPAMASINSAKHNFFVSSLVTAALTHHLAWLETAAPADRRHTGCIHADKSRAYCAQWMQLCQLYSVLGYPRRVSRTVLVGSNRNLLGLLLHLVSYFLRCSDVMLSDDNLPDEIHYQHPDRLAANQPHQNHHQCSASSSSSSDSTSDLDHSPPNSDYSATALAAAAAVANLQTAATVTTTSSSSKAAPSPSSDYCSDCEQHQHCLLQMGSNSTAVSNQPLLQLN